MPRDPVCKMEVEPSETATTTQFDDQTFYFCSLACKEEFEDDPELYLGTAA